MALLLRERMAAMWEATDALRDPEALEEAVALEAVVAASVTVGATETGPTVVGVGAVVASGALGVEALAGPLVATASGPLTTAWMIPSSRMPQ